MRAFIAFTKKEFIENLRSYRLYVLIAVFILIGIMNPLLALLMPQILGGMDLGNGMILEIPEPVALDSWTQFFSNIAQMGMLALIITFSGIMANEFSRGTLINLLTKGMKRQTVILSKFLCASIIWTGSYLLCLAITYAYTAFYWPGAQLDYLFLSFLAPWLFGEFIIALLIFGGILNSNYSGSLLVCGGVIVLLNLMNIIPNVRRFNPVTLAGGTINLLNAQLELSDFMPAIILCFLAILFLLIGSILMFNKKRI